MRSIIYIALIIIFSSLKISAEQNNNHFANCLIITTDPDSAHRSLPSELISRLNKNGIFSQIVLASSLENFQTKEEVISYLNNKLDSLKKNTCLQTGIFGIGPLGGIIAMETASSIKSIDFLSLISAIGTDGKDYLSDKMCELLYSGKQTSKMAVMRQEIREYFSNGINESSDFANSILPIFNNNMRRIMEFNINETLKTINCPVIITHLRHDGSVYWYPNLTNLEKLIKNNDINYVLLTLPEVDQYFEKAEVTLPEFVSIQYSPDYTPDYDLSSVDELCEAIIYFISQQ